MVAGGAAGDQGERMGSDTGRRFDASCMPAVQTADADAETSYIPQLCMYTQ